ncbi:hypothetical protein BT93_H1106 [Corymbia citriodora subsp. variegata]|nr:hypothetical protein BT93_H1106 [Corymbia citriodora subsp. variegata]
MGGRRPAKKSSSEEPLEFFKVYLPSFSSHQLLIPPDFIKNFKGVMPKKAVLKNTTGRSWPIGIAEVGDKLFIKRGWRDFVIDHSLDFADFLIFRYNGDSVFLVKVFGKNGCRKEMTNRVDRPLAVVKTEEQEDEEKEAEQNQRQPGRACKRKFSDLNINQMENHVLHGDSQFIAKQELVRESVSKCSVETCAVPKNPHFVSRISIYSLKVLNIPSSFLKGNHIKLNPNEKMIVRDQNGRTWPVQINERKGRFCLSSGWTEFRKANNLRVGNRCKSFLFLTDTQVKKAVGNISENKRCWPIIKRSHICSVRTSLPSKSGATANQKRHTTAKGVDKDFFDSTCRLQWTLASLLQRLEVGLMKDDKVCVRLQWLGQIGRDVPFEVLLKIIGMSFVSGLIRNVNVQDKDCARLKLCSTSCQIAQYGSHYDEHPGYRPKIGRLIKDARNVQDEASWQLLTRCTQANTIS